MKMTLKFNDITVNIENPKIQKKIQKFIFSMKNNPEKSEKRRWTDDEIAGLHELMNNRVPLPRIAESLGRSEKAVEMKLRAMGVQEEKVINL